MKTNDKNNNGGESREPERHTITLQTLRRQAICKKRYGRATLTIRRSGDYGGLVRETNLSAKLAAFRVGDATAEAVAWAFVRGRIKSHSPTFSWKGADLGRLIKLVIECSESPHFEAQTADALAAELIEKQDEEREQMKRLTAQFARSFSGMGGLSKLLQPQLAQWATQQNKLFQHLSRSFVTPAITKQMAGLAAPSLNEQMRPLGLTESVRKGMFPTLAPGLASSLVAGTCRDKHCSRSGFLCRACSTPASPSRFNTRSGSIGRKRWRRPCGRWREVGPSLSARSFRRRGKQRS